MKENNDYPLIADKLNRGAFLLTPIWAFYHKKYIVGILSLIPIIGQVVSLVALFYGGKWAWESRDWETEFFFKESLLKWNVAGVSVTLIIFTILLILSVVMK